MTRRHCGSTCRRSGRVRDHVIPLASMDRLHGPSARTFGLNVIERLLAFDMCRSDLPSKKLIVYSGMLIGDGDRQTSASWRVVSVSVRWTAFADNSPDLARRGKRLLAESHGYAFLATVADDGSPRVHPVAPILSESGLFLAVTSHSPKHDDLAADHRVALHSSVHPPDDEEFWLRGVVHEVHGAASRKAAVAGASGAVLSQDMTLFEVDLVSAGWSTWRHERPMREHWHE
jgi:hypothetical protein